MNFSWGQRVENLVQKCSCGRLLSFAMVTPEPCRHPAWSKRFCSQLFRCDGWVMPKCHKSKDWDWVQLPFLNFKPRFRSIWTTINTEKFYNLLRKERKCQSFFFQEKQKGGILHVRKQFTLLISGPCKRSFLSLLCFPILTEESQIPFYNVKCLSPVAWHFWVASCHSWKTIVFKWSENRICS